MADHTLPSISTQIDILLESYLTLLDTYTTLRANLSKEFSAGFFSLAQAQRSSTLGSGRRYGEDFYDERMKAGRGVSIRMSRTVTEGETDDDAHHGEGIIEVSVRRIEASQSQSSDTNTSETSSTKSETDSTNPTTTTTKPKDPLRWFGILTPPALRQSQTAFIGAIEGLMPALINTSNQMLALEREIEDLRALLEADIQKEDLQEEEEEEKEKEEDEDQEVEAEEEEMSLRSDNAASRSNVLTENLGAVIGKPPSLTKQKNNTNSTLPSRPSEPRSRVLKID
jgi:coiled-coil domain-containing protein 115